MVSRLAVATPSATAKDKTADCPHQQHQGFLRVYTGPTTESSFRHKLDMSATEDESIFSVLDVDHYHTTSTACTTPAESQESMLAAERDGLVSVIRENEFPRLKGVSICAVV